MEKGKFIENYIHFSKKINKINKINKKKKIHGSFSVQISQVSNNLVDLTEENNLFYINLIHIHFSSSVYDLLYLFCRCAFQSSIIRDLY